MSIEMSIKGINRGIDRHSVAEAKAVYTVVKQDRGEKNMRETLIGNTNYRRLFSTFF